MRILLPIDGSDCSKQAVDWAAETFDKLTTHYYLFFVIPVLPDLNTVEYDIVDAMAMLKRNRHHLEKLGCIVDRAEYALGDTVDQICRYADEIAADQIVIGSHGRTGLAKLLMGSTSIKVLEHSERPVTVHRESTRPAEKVDIIQENTLL